MKLSTQRKIDRFAGAFLCRIFSLFSRKKTANTSPNEIKRILILLLSELGSLILAQPMIQHIKMRYPKASVFFMVFKQNTEVLELLETIPLNHIYPIRNTSFLALIRDSITALIKIRREKIDTVIDCELFSRISSIFSFLSGAPIRVGFHRHTQEGLYRGDFINRPILYNPYVHISKQFINMVDGIESQDWPPGKSLIEDTRSSVPSVSINKDDLGFFQSRLQADFPAVSEARLVLIYPSGGLLPIRAWPLSHFISLVRILIQNKYCVGVIGLHQDKHLAKGITGYCHSEHVFDMTGYTHNLKELIMLFQLASLLITNDGGPGHLAALTSLPTIILYGPETPIIYGSLSPNAINLSALLSCSPCLTAYNHRNSPCDGNNICLKKISFEEVSKKAYEILESQRL
ncbi:MAG: hypothetical protein A2V65_09830 [Deltaproteobacteria bacterium RBG_13_49_15]|nr:MAG: hypothetical protein A2V65_09830 [Deltaproteobacteria bacterium RBG_13_49_15]